MTHNLVPRFILEKYAANEHSGRFSAAALFVDISGFSALTDQLMQHGQHGAEVLAGVMGAIFEPLINAVYSQGGFVTGFAGDAFTAVFPYDHSSSVKRALAAAVTIQEQMQNVPQQKTAYGRFPMSAKVGVAFGEVIWGIVTSEDESRATYYFQGTAIDGCANAEHAAEPGDIILATDFYEKIQDSVSGESVGDHFRLTAVNTHLPTPNQPALPIPETDQLAHFVPEAAIHAGRTGEFRQVVNLFISLPTVRTEAQLDIFMQTVFNLQDRYDGLLKQLDYGDKGAKLLLFWGAPVARENDIQRALHFILDLQTQTAIPINGGLTYHVAHAGYIGSSLRGEYTCYGRGVNLAARFMTAAPRGEIWVDEHIARRAGEQFDLEFESEKSFKGFAEPQKVYILFERKDIADTLYDGRLVGRESELSQMSEFVAPIDNGRNPGMLVIWGEPGAGKSRLAHEFLTHHLNLEQETQVFLAQSDEILRQSLNPFRYWLKRYFNQSEGLGESRNKRSFNRKLDDLISDSEEQSLADELDRVRSFLGALVGLHWPDSLYEQVDAKRRQEHTLAALTALLKAESRRRPIILLLEDAHWIDRDSADFLSTLLSELEEPYPLAILATARYEGHGLPLEGFSYGEINLSGLNQADLAALAETYLDGPPAKNLLDLLVERAEGNPFFAEQLLRYLQEANQLQLVDERWQIVALERSPLPGDVNALLVARLDRLTRSVREVVQTAAVLGREFEIRLLSQMLHDDTSLPEKIAQVEQESIWSALSEIRYIFKHGLLRDAAYRMQLRARRQALHKLAMEALESLYNDDLSGRFGELAYHALSAKLPGPSFQYSLAAGDEAMQRYAAAEAVAHYRPAMELLDQLETTSEQRHQLCLHYGRALELIGDPAAALDHYEKMEQLALDMADQPLELTALVAIGTIRSTGNVVGNTELAEALSQKGLELAYTLNDKAAEAKIYWNLLNVYRRLGRYQESLESGLRAYELAETFGLREQMAYVANDLNTVYMGLGQIDKMLVNSDRAVKLWRELENQPMLIDGLAISGMAKGTVGRFDEALAIAEEALTLSHASNNRWGEAFTRYTPAVVHLQRMEIAEGLEHSKTSIRLAQEAGVTIVQVYSGTFQSLLYLAGRDLQQVISTSSQTLSVAEQHLPFLIPMINGVLAIAKIELGDIEAAGELVNSYQLDLDNLGMLKMMTPELGRSHYLLARGNYAAILPITGKVIEFADRQDISLLYPQFCYIHGQAQLALQNQDDARKTFQKGLSQLREKGGRWGYVELANALAKLEEQEGNETTAKQLRTEIQTIKEHLKKQNILLPALT